MVGLKREEVAIVGSEGFWVKMEEAAAAVIWGLKP